WPNIHGDLLDSILRILRATERGCDRHVIAEKSKYFAHELFDGKVTVHFSGIEECDTAFDRCTDERDAFLLLHGGPQAKAQSHTAASDGGDFQITLSMSALTQGSSLLRIVAVDYGAFVSRLPSCTQLQCILLRA